MRTIITLSFIFIIITSSYPQYQIDEYDKCGYNSKHAKSYLKILGDHWGYSYDSLMVDLEKWSESPYIKIDSLGASVQNRAIWQLTIASEDTSDLDKQTVFLHARTHPGEVQSWWVTEQVINQLTSESEFAQLMRANCVFYIVPMYNPDGVELEYARENANGVDIESNWDAITLQPEVSVLKARFTELMASDEPIQVAMNMHSAYGTNRYFVFHSSIGTSNQYVILEQNYIGGVRSYYLEGIRPWDFMITWTTGTPTYYPESWFWLNHQEDVMALTYEDWNSDLAANFDSTANAMLRGIADYLDIRPSGIETEQALVRGFDLYQNYPNPFNPSTTIEYHLPQQSEVSLIIYSALGQFVRNLTQGRQTSGKKMLTWDGINEQGKKVGSGIYIARMQADNQIKSIKMILLR